MAQSAAVIFLSNIIFPNGEFNTDIHKIQPQQQQKL